MTTMFFLRHGPTEENHENRIQGQLPGTLIVHETEAYLSAITPLLREKNPEILISSDLDRAVQTREILKSFLQTPAMKVGVSPLLREKAMGFYEGMLWDEVPVLLKQQRSAESYDFRKFGGENDEDVRNRMKEFLRQFGQRYDNRRIAVVTHAGWLKQLVSMADKSGVLPDGWTERTAIYEAGVNTIGELKYFHPIQLKAQLPQGD